MKWQGVLSVNAPYTDMDLFKVRQGNTEETFGFQIIKNNKPYDLTGKRVLFCTAFDLYSADGTHKVTQENATILNAETAQIQYTMSQDAMYRPERRQKAYFEIYQGENKIDTTQNFYYTIQKSVRKQLVDGDTHSVLLEEIYQLYEEYMIEQKKSWEEFVADNREILESIDPGGTILKEILAGRGGEKSLNDRMVKDKLELEQRIKDGDDFILEFIFKQVPSGFKFIIEHDSEYQPDVKVTSYRNALGVEKDGFDTVPVFGGETISNVPTHLSYDRKKAYIEMPLFYALKGAISIPVSDTLLIINGIDVLCFKVSGARITAGEYPAEEPTTLLRVPRDLELTALDDNAIKLTWKRGA